MSSTLTQSEPATRRAGTLDTKLEVVVIPVSDIDRAKRFYSNLGWRVDADFTNGNDWRAVQMTPPGSPCSIIFGQGGVSTAAPGSAQGLFLVVDDVQEARARLAGQGADVSEPFHFENELRVSDATRRLPGKDPQNRSYLSWASFKDPDGNEWLLQEITTRLPGRGFNLDVNLLTDLLRETEEHHGQYEPTAPKHHWSGWYAAYMVARERGKSPEEAAREAKAHIESAGR